MNEYPKKRKRKTLHPSRYSDSSGISRIADGFNGIFSDHCYSVCSMRQPDLKYFDNKDDDSDTETSNDLPKFADGIKARNRNQNYLHKRTDSNVCRVCKESFSTNMLLIEHAKLHEEDPYICKYCDYRTVIFENLSQHIADTHFSDHLYWCEQCDVQFSSSSELYLHFQEHSCDEQYLCQFCEHETNDPEDLHSHVVNEHACKLIELSDKYNNGEHGQYSLLSKITFDKCKNFFVCQVCGFRSRLHTNVNRHVAIEHTKIFPHVCDDCGKGFSSMLEYCKHLNSHLSEGIYLCQYCEYSTGQIEDLKIHLDFKHSADLPHKCSDCLMRFGNERELISHLPVHETT
ncbi:hypothetical protein H1C71_023817 [Ictidomys tridecemlineatus]|uniref:zinc finger protein 639 n=1 Tax=Ictidomys tridecemlineatus TaxID=43179 RepID=UPI00038C0709|nr:zinc finger protein 639 [Ictidomys tridecemlineatus]KAG3271029.1 hypothetical protein H1C71_023817 [Ictidomys tridecemlineatus]